MWTAPGCLCVSYALYAAEYFLYLVDTWRDPGERSSICKMSPMLTYVWVHILNPNEVLEVYLKEALRTL